MEIQKGIDIKDYLISIVSSSNGIDEPTVSKVVEWAFKEAKKEVRNQSSVEFTGFGTYLIYPSKHRKVKAEKEEMLGRLEKRIEENNPKDNIKYYKDILEVTKEFLEFFNRYLCSVWRKSSLYLPLL